METETCSWKRSKFCLVSLAVAVMLVGMFMLCAPAVNAANFAVELISVALDGSNQGNGWCSTIGSLSDDGNYVAFESIASNLVATDTNGGIQAQDIFVRDRASGTTTLVSVNNLANDSGNSASRTPSMSANGQYVVFQSMATDLVAGFVDGNHPNSGEDIFVRDLINNTTALVSVNSSGTASGNDSSLFAHIAHISGNGTYVAFESFATNLVSGFVDNNTTTWPDVFVRDLNSSTTYLVSCRFDDTTSGGNDESYGTYISANGHYVAFSSAATDLVAGFTDGNLPAREDVFVRDLIGNTTTLVSVNRFGTASGDSGSAANSISADGRYVVFESSSTDLVAGDTNGRVDVFVRDLQMGQTTRVSVDSAGREGNGNSDSGVISPDGRFVAFTSWSTNLVPNETNGSPFLFPHGFVHDRQTGVTTLVSASVTGVQGNAASVVWSLNPGAGFAGMSSDANNLVSGDGNGVQDVFLAVLDKDGDGIADWTDTCPGDYNAYDPINAFNRQLRDTDGDGIMDACDNCPSVRNPDQVDADGNGIGEDCEPYKLAAESAPSLPVTKGAPLWDKICVTNTSEAPITIIRPDCYNIHTRWRKALDQPPVVPRDRHGEAYSIPDDLATLPAHGEACVYCDLSETVAPAHLEGVEYLVDHTYTNWVQDPEYDFINHRCLNELGEPCYPDVWIGWMSTGEPKHISVQVPQDPVQTLQAQCTFSPEVWMTAWATITTTKVITATVSGINFFGLISSSITLNGHTAPISSSVDSSGNLVLQFNRKDAVNSLQSPVVAGRFFQTIQGMVGAGTFTAQSPIVLLDALNVAIDIKPGTYPNSINLGSNGNVPVAIFSNSSFDATTIDPYSVTLADAKVRVKGKKGELMASKVDVNGDGLLDLLVHIDTTSLELTGADVEAVLKGVTYDGDPVVGKDWVRIVP